jgi:hypothetical protein
MTLEEQMPEPPAGPDLAGLAAGLGLEFAFAFV